MPSREDFSCDICYEIGGKKNSNPLSGDSPDFHAYCDKCHSESENVAEEDPSLCFVCQHMRIPHLLQCVDTSWDGVAGNTPRFDFTFSFNELQERASGCRVCCFLRNMLLSHHHILGMDGPDMSNISMSMWIRNKMLEWNSKTANGDMVGPGTLDVLKMHDTSSSFPSLDQFVDWEKVTSWVESAVLNSDKHPRWPKNLKVIDVEQDCVVEAPENCAYIALSYVWGDINHAPVAVDKSGSFDRRSFPLTLQDAMIACAKMGSQYVWIDQVCINQEDEKEKSQQINQMDLVYQCATCTIVALTGKDSLYGLPGVSSPRRWNFTNNVEVGNINLVGQQAPSFIQCFQQSRWATRGWTFQELVFSDRLLFFTEYGVHFVHQGVKGERIQSEANSVSSNSPGSSSISPRLRSFPSRNEYWFSLEEYMTRSLKYSSDTIPAISGALNAIFGDDTIWGMPLHHIDQAMVWSAITSHPNQKERPGYPSWSWASHSGHIEHLQGYAGLAFWAIHVPQYGPSTAITVCKPAKETKWGVDTLRDYDRSMDRSLIRRLIPPLMAGCFRIPPPLELQQQCSTCAIEHLVTRWPTYDAFWNEAFAPCEAENNAAVFSPDDLKAVSSSAGRIIVHSQSAYFQIRAPKYEPLDHKFSRIFREWHQSYPLWIYAANGSFVGGLRVPSYEQSAILDTVGEFLLLSIGDDNGICGVIHDHSVNCADITGCPCCRRQKSTDSESTHFDSHINNCPLDGEEINHYGAVREVFRFSYPQQMSVASLYSVPQPCQSHASDHREYLGDQPVLNVMLIQRNHGSETNVARRCGVGQIYLKKWTEASPEFKTVILE